MFSAKSILRDELIFNFPTIHIQKKFDNLLVISTMLNYKIETQFYAEKNTVYGDKYELVSSPFFSITFESEGKFCAMNFNVNRDDNRSVESILIIAREKSKNSSKILSEFSNEKEFNSVLGRIINFL